MEKFAVYLNANARKVNQTVVDYIEELVPPSDIYYARTFKDSYSIASEIERKNYKTVFAGGGDGTVVQFINAVLSAASEKHKSAKSHKHSAPILDHLPNIGILSLGTGNALGKMYSSGSAISDLKSFVSNPRHDIETLSLIESEGKLVPFLGFGKDAELLNDFDALKKIFSNGRLRPLFSSVYGYFGALFVRTIPRTASNAIKGKTVSARVINLGNEAFSLTHDSSCINVFTKGQVLYEGQITIILAGTIPFYGYGMKVLPFALRRKNFFHLRVSPISVAKVLVNLPSIWKGEFRGSEMIDFHASHIRVEFSEKMPLQMAGDALGYRDTIEMKILPDCVKILKFI
jgi:diacylglycerol kinase family enzyme